MGTSMPDDGKTQWIDKRSIEGLTAIAEFTIKCGVGPSVMDDDDWAVRIGHDGRPVVTMRQGGLRTLAAYAPDPVHAHRMASQVIARMDRLEGQG